MTEDTLFTVDDVFIVDDRLVAAGSVKRGRVTVGDTLQVRGRTRSFRVTTIERYRQQLHTVPEGEAAGITLEAATPEDIKPGDELSI